MRIKNLRVKDLFLIQGLESNIKIFAFNIYCHSYFLDDVKLILKIKREKLFPEVKKRKMSMASNRTNNIPFEFIIYLQQHMC